MGVPRVSAGFGVSPRRVVVAGDVTMDWHLARTRELVDSGVAWNADDRTEVYAQFGGAGLTAGLMVEVASGLTAVGVAVDVVGPQAPAGPIAPSDPRVHHAYASWAKFPQRAGDRDRSVWRVQEFLGLDRARTPAEGQVVDLVDGGGPVAVPDVVILDDAGLGFRDHRRCWPAGLYLGGDEPVSVGGLVGDGQPWVVLKLARPVASGELWQRVLRWHAGRLVVVMTLDDLRGGEVRLSRELSWERIAGDLVGEVLRHPGVNGLAHCAHVVVSLGTGGAVLLSRRGPLAGGSDRLEVPDCHVFFDPEAIENSWAEEYPGSMIGDTTCLVGGIARELLLNPDNPDVHRGVSSGLGAVRDLHRGGYGAGACDPGRAGLAFPACEIAKQLGKVSGEFSVARVAQPVSQSWSILEGRYPEGLEPVAEAVARQGVRVALDGVPLGVFGKFVTVDRGEIEDFGSIRGLMREYNAEPAPRPLNIAVFGPPGAGKSFGVKAVVKSALDSQKLQELSFNLSQMRDPSELADALHQVRDAGLRGRLPFVLWDEFDSDLAGAPFGWLRHFLAPMQDGAFQQGQVLHPIGKAIFVFAGGTSSRLADFVANGSSEFRLAKGPDFASRIKGHVDIVGPDPRGGDLQGDPYARIRRAILLRSMLKRDRPGLFTNDAGVERLRIDPGVLRAFLEVRSYRHGARSMETIVAMSALHARTSYERSALPAADQLDAHVDAREFLSIVERFIPGGQLLERLAEAVHVVYCAQQLAQGHPWGGTAEYLTEHPMLKEFATRSPSAGTLPALVDYRMLPQHLREQNRGVAQALPDKLDYLGLVLRADAPAGAPGIGVEVDDRRVEVLAKREHERWVRRQQRTGWRYGDPRDDARKVHPCIRAWADLTEEQRDQDRWLITGMPQIVAAAGMTLAHSGEPPELRIGVTGHRVLAEIDRVQAGIDAALTGIESSYPGRRPVVVSPLAEGADRLVAQAVLKRPGSRLEAVLPLPKFDFLNDFATPESKEQFLGLLSQADKVIELPPQASRHEAYGIANECILGSIDVLVAVWDGKDPQGQGGTGQAVARARNIDYPWPGSTPGTANRTPTSQPP